MAVVWMSFRISEDAIGGRDYDDRLKALTDIFYGAGLWWDRTTSFIAVDTEIELSTLAQAAKKAIAPAVDVVLMRQMDSKSAYIIGTHDDPDIHKLMPYLKKL